MRIPNFKQLTHMPMIRPGYLYLLPSKRIARCTSAGESVVTFEYGDDNSEGCTLATMFAERHVVLMPGQLTQESERV